MQETERFLRSFGRRKGRVFSPAQQALIAGLLPEYHCNPQARPGDGIWELEIGFGAGEHLLARAEHYPDRLIIGCEPYMNGVVNLLQELEQRPQPNLRLWTEDARDLLQALPDASFQHVHVLFPDPWPKKRHHKRRLVSHAMLALLRKKIQTGGILQLATDHADYAGWMLAHTLASEGWQWQARCRKDWETPPENWTPTRYQQKAAMEGRQPMFFRFQAI